MRIIEVISFICERDLAIRVSDLDIGSNHNGNYLGILELVSIDTNSKYYPLFVYI